MARAPKHLVWIGDAAWVDPAEVIAVDAHFETGAPAWARVRIILSTDRVIYGMRSPARVAQAIRHPELESEVDEALEPPLTTEELDEDRRRRRVRTVPAALEPLRRSDEAPE